MRKFIIPLLLAVILITSGCITFEEETTPCIEPEKFIDGRCCFDEDDNGVCDIDERSCPESCDDGDPCTNDHCSFETNFECVHDEITPCCGNGVCEDSEDMANECPEDCTVIDMTDFIHMHGGPDYMEDEKFVFIHTGSNETDRKTDFYLNITADDMDIDNIRVTYNCNDSATGGTIDSIDVDKVEVAEGYPLFGYENEFENDNYLIYTSFYSKNLGTDIDVDELDHGQTVEFRVKFNKKNYKTRSDLDCDFTFYFLEPLKKVRKNLKISYI